MLVGFSLRACTYRRTARSRCLRTPCSTRSCGHAPTPQNLPQGFATCDPSGSRGLGIVWAPNGAERALYDPLLSRARPRRHHPGDRTAACRQKVTLSRGDAVGDQLHEVGWCVEGGCVAPLGMVEPSSARRLGHEWATNSCLHRQRAVLMRGRREKSSPAQRRLDPLRRVDCGFSATVLRVVPDSQ
jgi:hypothetical protein